MIIISTFTAILNNALIYYLIKKKIIDAKIIIIYFNLLSILGIFLQIFYIKFQSFL